MKHTDIAIIGGGMVGLTLAIALEPALKAGARLTLIDPAPEPSGGASHSPSFDDRATALAAFSRLAYERLGVWPALAGHASEIRQIEVSDRGHAGYQLMDAARLGESFGAVVANANLGRALWQRASALDGPDWRFGDSVTRLVPGADHQRLMLASGDSLDARLVILCDGGRSPLIDRLGLAQRHQDYRARARVATVRTSEAHRGRAFERFTEDGPIALLPFGDYSALVWTVPDRLQGRVDAMTPQQQLSWLNDRFGQRLGRITEIGETLDYPLGLRQLSEPVRPRLLALGNATATLHPVAGQGFNLAIRGLMRTAARLNEHLAEAGDPGDYAILRGLSDAIAADQARTARFSDTLVRAFASANPLVRIGRNLGLNLLDRHPRLSHRFALTSMGLTQGAPLPEDTP